MIRAVSPSARSRRWRAALVAALGSWALASLPGPWTPPAQAGMYTWVDDEGNHHLVDSREKVPPRYRSRAKSIEPEQLKPAPAVPRDGSTPRSERAESGRDTVERERKSRGHAGGDREASDREVSSLTSRWRESLGAVDPRAWLDALAPRPRLLRLALIGLGAAALVRALGSVRAFRSARVLRSFRIRYESFLKQGELALEDPLALSLEAELPSVTERVRAARIGPTTIGASREVGGMGRVVDEGRIDVVRACLVQPGPVGSHMLSVLRRAEGVYRFRAVRPWLPLGWVETIVFWPRFLLRPDPRSQPAGQRLVLVTYWFLVLACSVLG